MSWDVPHSALIWPDPEADNPALDDSDTGFGWLKRYIDDQPAARQSHEPRLLYGPASHPTLAAVHHDRPTIAVSCATSAPRFLRCADCLRAPGPTT